MAVSEATTTMARAVADGVRHDARDDAAADVPHVRQKRYNADHRRVRPGTPHPRWRR